MSFHLFLAHKATRCLADQSSGGNKSTDNKPKQAAKPSKKAATDSCSVPPPAAPAKKQAESLGKPGKPSDKYEAPEYFGYNEYSFNDLISEMEKSRNPQPRPK